MNIKNQVINLEQAKRLKELGISQDSYFSWFGDETPRLMDNGADPMTYGGWVFVSTTIPANNQEADHRADTSNTKPIAAAFTVAELGVMLGPLISFETHVDRTFSAIIAKDHFDHPAIKEDFKFFIVKSDHSEAEARAALLINLLDNKLITVEDCNERLSE